MRRNSGDALFDFTGSEQPEFAKISSKISSIQKKPGFLVFPQNQGLLPRSSTTFQKKSFKYNRVSVFWPE